MRIYTVFNFHINPYKKLILWHFLTFPTGWLIGNPSMRVYTFTHSALYGICFILLIDTKRLSGLLLVQIRKIGLFKTGKPGHKLAATKINCIFAQLSSIIHKECVSSSPFLNFIRNELHLRGYSLKTEKSYLYWIKYFIRFHMNLGSDEKKRSNISIFHLPPNIYRDFL